jgi:hypothetical protein
MLESPFDALDDLEWRYGRARADQELADIRGAELVLKDADVVEFVQLSEFI